MPEFSKILAKIQKGDVTCFCEGKEVARSKGRKTDDRYSKNPPEFESFYALWKNGKVTVKEACNQLEIGRTTWYKLCKEVE